MNKKRNSTGSALGDAKHAHKISNSSNRKVSSSIRADSTEDHKLSLGVRIKNAIKIFHALFFITQEIFLIRYIFLFTGKDKEKILGCPVNYGGAKASFETDNVQTI